MTDHSQQIVTVFGGSGFVGRYIVRDLANAGYRVRAVVRDTEAGAFLKTYGHVGQIAVVHGDILDEDSYKAHLKDAYGVINLVGILFEKGKQTFKAVHACAAEKLAQHAQKAGVARYAHMSALGVEDATSSSYAKTKLAGERAVTAAFPNATIIRPSIVFGIEDNFYNQFACMSRFAPALPLIGGGQTKFQPVYVADVAKAFARSLQDDAMQGNIYQLGGPEVMSFKEILQSINRYTHRDTMLLPVPSGIAKFGATFAQHLPTPPLTPDQVELLKYDNVVQDDALTFSDINIVPVHPDSVVPDYLSRYARDVNTQHVA